MKYSLTLVLCLVTLLGDLCAQIPVAGKMLFSTQPFTAGGGSSTKNSFTSAEYIYGRFELDGATIREAFKMDETSKLPPSIICNVSIFKGDYEMELSRNNYILLDNDQKGSSSLNFDVFPEPKNAKTLYSMLDDFSAGFGYIPLYGAILNEQPAAGNYRIVIKIFNHSKDGWGKEEEWDKWPTLSGEFQFTMRDADIAKIKRDDDALDELLDDNAFRHEKMPDIFSKGAVIADAKGSNAKVLAILKRDLGHRTILKMAIEKSGGTLWSIAKDEYGLPKYRYYTPTVHIAYKQDGKCYIGTATLREVYSGGGTYGPLQVGFTSQGGTGGDRGIDCVLVK